jgi:hypothetical protein
LDLRAADDTYAKHRTPSYTVWMIYIFDKHPRSAIIGVNDSPFDSEN